MRCTMHRCSNPATCNKIVNEKGYHIWIGKRPFCSQECVNEYLAQEKRFQDSANPFKDWNRQPAPEIPPRVPIVMQQPQWELQLDD